MTLQQALLASPPPVSSLRTLPEVYLSASSSPAQSLSARYQGLHCLPCLPGVPPAESTLAPAQSQPVRASPSTATVHRGVPTLGSRALSQHVRVDLSTALGPPPHLAAVNSIRPVGPRRLDWPRAKPVQSFSLLSLQVASHVSILPEDKDRWEIRSRPLGDFQWSGLAALGSEVPSQAPPSQYVVFDVDHHATVRPANAMWTLDHLVADVLSFLPRTRSIRVFQHIPSRGHPKRRGLC